MGACRTLGTIALTLVASVAAFIPLAFQPQLVSDGIVTGTSTVRVTNLGFTEYNALNKYAAYFCETPAQLVAVNTEFAVIRVTERPDSPRKCPLTLWDLATQKPVYRGGDVTFADAPWGNADAVALNVVPSFYFASRVTTTRVSVVGKGFKEVSKVTGTAGEGDCSDIITTDDGFSCSLPVIPAPKIDSNAAIQFRVTSANGDTRFAIQALSGEFEVVVKSAVPETLRSGDRVTILLNHRLTVATQLPWAPVLVHTATGEIEHDAVFSDLVWDEPQTSLAATVNCPSCRPGSHSVHLGEAIYGKAAPIISADQRSSVSVTFREPECEYAGRPLPSVITADDLDEVNRVHLFLSLDLATAPRTAFRATAGDAAIPFSATVTPHASLNGAFLTLSPSGKLPADREYDLTIYAVTEAGRVLEACTVTKSFRVKPYSGADAAVITGSPRRFFAVGDLGSQEEYLTFYGRNLEAVASVRLVFEDSGAASEAVCEYDSSSSSEVCCTLDGTAIINRGGFSFVFYDGAKTELARSHGYFAVGVPEVTGFYPGRIYAGTASRVAASLERTPAANIPVGFVLLNEANAKISVTPQWTGANAATLADAAPRKAGRGYVAFRGHYPGGEEELLFSPDAQFLTIDRELEPIVPAVAAVYPAVLQLGAVAAGLPTVLRLELEYYDLIVDKVVRVTVNGATATILGRAGGLFVSAVLPRATGRVPIKVFGAQSIELVAATSVTIEENLPEGYYIRSGASDVAALARTGYITAVFDVAGLPVDGAITVGADRGIVKSNTREAVGDYTRVSVIIIGLGDSVGSQVTISLSTGGAEAIHIAYHIVQAPRVQAVWPASKRLDFTAARPDCVPYAVTVSEINPRNPLALAFPTNAGIVLASASVDVATRTYTGCLRCVDCVPGTYTGVLAAPFSRGGPTSVPAGDEFVFDIVAPAPVLATLVAAVVAISAAPAARGESGAGLSTTETVAIAAAAGAAALAALAAVFAWRRRRAAASLKPSAELAVDLLALESASV